MHQLPKSECRTPEYTHEENLTGEIRYTERAESPADRRPSRVCELWTADLNEYVSRCTVLSFTQRIGAAQIESEGFAGVHTPPAHRKKGYVGHLLTHALKRMSRRVDIAWLYGVNDLYDKYGFVSCWAECEIRLSVLDGIRVICPAGVEVRPLSEQDWPAVCALYNDDHAARSWTHVRTAGQWQGPRKAESWSPGQDGVVAVADGRIEGAALFDTQSPGTRSWRLAVELWASSDSAARALIAESIKRAMAERRETLTFLEPQDSCAGRALKRAGCESVVRTNPYGGGMGVILNRANLVGKLGPELARRADSDHPDALKALANGDLVPDNSLLLRLLTGFYSWHDAEESGYALPERFREICKTWFPGWGPLLPVAFTHNSDRY